MNILSMNITTHLISKNINLQNLKMQHVSKTATQLYSVIDDSFTTNDDEKRAVCTLSLADPSEVKGYFEWITIPSGRGAHHKYAVDTYAAYVAQELMRGVIKDPLKIFADLRFMSTRMNRLMSMPSALKQMPVGDVTQDFKKRVAKAFFRLPQDAYALPYNTAKDLGLLVSITTLDELKLLHTSFQTPQDAIDCLRAKTATPKSYLLRTSTKGDASGAGDCTVFTISFVTATNTVFHIRLVDMHGVGIYVATDDPDKRLRCANLNYGQLLQKSDMREILVKINYESPPYACIVDCLIDLERLGYISIEKIVV